MSRQTINPQPPKLLDEARSFWGFRDGTIYQAVKQRDKFGRFFTDRFELHRIHPRRHELKKQIKQMRKESIT